MRSTPWSNTLPAGRGPLRLPTRTSLWQPPAWPPPRSAPAIRCRCPASVDRGTSQRPLSSPCERELGQQIQPLTVGLGLHDRRLGLFPFSLVERHHRRPEISNRDRLGGRIPDLLTRLLQHVDLIGRHRYDVQIRLTGPTGELTVADDPVLNVLDQRLDDIVRGAASCHHVAIDCLHRSSYGPAQDIQMSQPIMFRAAFGLIDW